MNEKVYLRFENPEERPRSGWVTRIIENTVVKVVSAFIPKANPDFEDLFEEVKYWKIEIDLTDNLAVREIGFNKVGAAIVGMPFGQNYGYWTDSQLAYDDYKTFKSIELTDKEFENDWSEFLNTIKLKKT